MTDQPSVEEAHTESCRRFSVIVARRQDEFQHVCICGAAARADTLRRVREAVRGVKTHTADGYFGELAKMDEIEAALDRIQNTK